MFKYLLMEKEFYSYKSDEELEPYDKDLFESLLDTASFQAYEYFNGDKNYRNEQKRQFLTNEITNPQLDYPDIDIDKINQVENILLSIKTDLILNEQNEVVKQAYRWKINEKIAEIRMMKSVANGDMKRFKRYSEFVYGEPSTEIFDYTINSISTEAEIYVDSDNSEISEAANNLLAILPEVDSKALINLPNKLSVDFAREQTLNELGDLIDIPDELTVINAEQIHDAFKSALTKVGGEDWRINIDYNRTAVGVNQENESVNIPSDRTVSRKKLCGLILHEIGTHVARRINGKNSRLRLLEIGLDRYESGEEGVATMREQALSGEVDDFKGLDGHLAISLSLGLDGQARDFRQVYDILERYYLFKNLISKKDYLKSFEKAQNTAWNRCVRTFRGTDCITPGVCFTKDIVYREGNIGVWDIIDNNPEEMIKFNIGKYDPTSSRHLWVLTQLGITDQDLDSVG